MKPYNVGDLIFAAVDPRCLRVVLEAKKLDNHAVYLMYVLWSFKTTNIGSIWSVAIGDDEPPCSRYVVVSCAGLEDG